MKINLIRGQLTKNFKLDEFVCTQDDNAMVINERFFEFVNMLQLFRNWYCRPMKITSGYRTPYHNARLKGSSPNSKHMQGLAVDIELPFAFKFYKKSRKEEFLKNMKNKWFELCDEKGYRGGFGFYNTHVHMDIGYRDYRSFWDNRS